MYEDNGVLGGLGNNLGDMLDQSKMAGLLSGANTQTSLPLSPVAGQWGDNNLSKLMRFFMMSPAEPAKLVQSLADKMNIPTYGALPSEIASDPYNTQLSDHDESQFQRWKEKYAAWDSGNDYDLRGAFKAGLTPDPKTGHWPDTFKKPNHPTFSNESMYAKYAPEKAGHWDNDVYIKPRAKK